MSYGDNVVLDDLDIEVPQGQVVALLGPNGAGKTTTVEILEGFRRRSAGTVASTPRRRGAPGWGWCCRAGGTTRPGG